MEIPFITLGNMVVCRHKSFHNSFWNKEKIAWVDIGDATLFDSGGFEPEIAFPKFGEWISVVDLIIKKD